MGHREARCPHALLRTRLRRSSIQMRTRTRATTRALPAILVAAALGLVAAPVARAAVAPAHSTHKTAPAVATSPVAPATDTIVKHAFSPATMTVPVGTV